MEKSKSKLTLRKVLMALLPALIFSQNHAWMTLNAYTGISFLIIWALMIWNIWKFTDKNHIVERCFRLTEIAFFLLPLSAVIFTFVLGSKAISTSGSELEQAGAAVGTAIGGIFVVILAFIIGIAGGIIMHLITAKYEKKKKDLKVKQYQDLATKHGVVLSIVAIFFLAIFMGSIAGASQDKAIETQKEELSQSLKQVGSVKQNIETKEVELELVSKSFHEADFMLGEYEDKIKMPLKFTNKTNKSIRGVQGVITFYDIFDNKIKALNVSYDEGLKPNEIKVWNAEIGYNQFMDGDVKLRNTKIENLKYKWDVDTVIYE